MDWLTSFFFSKKINDEVDFVLNPLQTNEHQKWGKVKPLPPLPRNKHPLAAKQTLSYSDSSVKSRNCTQANLYWPDISCCTFFANYEHLFLITLYHAIILYFLLSSFPWTCITFASSHMTCCMGNLSYAKEKPLELLPVLLHLSATFRFLTTIFVVICHRGFQGWKRKKETGQRLERGNFLQKFLMLLVNFNYKHKLC